MLISLLTIVSVKYANKNKQTNKQTNDSINILETSSRDELLKIENSNDCCTTQHPLWIQEYSQAAECNREEKYRMIYADQDEQRGCVKIITRTALSFMPVLIAELVCGCLCLLLGLWSIYIIYHITYHYNKMKTNEPVGIYSDHQSNKIVPEVTMKGNQENKIVNSPNTPRLSHQLNHYNKIDRSSYANNLPLQNIKVIS